VRSTRVKRKFEYGKLKLFHKYVQHCSTVGVNTKRSPRLGVRADVSTLVFSDVLLYVFGSMHGVNTGSPYLIADLLLGHKLEKGGSKERGTLELGNRRARTSQHRLDRPNQ
jgi:hypothetical protein